MFFEDKLVHYSAFTGRYWRFPCLGDDDIQIGDTWTDPAHRSKGIASFAIDQIVSRKQKPGRQFWYCVEAINRSSIRVADSAGFEVVGEGIWRKPFGLKLLGSYVLLTASAQLQPTSFAGCLQRNPLRVVSGSASTDDRT